MKKLLLLLLLLALPAVGDQVKPCCLKIPVPEPPSGVVRVGDCPAGVSCFGYIGAALIDDALNAALSPAGEATISAADLDEGSACYEPGFIPETIGWYRFEKLDTDLTTVLESTEGANILTLSMTLTCTDYLRDAGNVDFRLTIWCNGELPPTYEACNLTPDLGSVILTDPFAVC